MHPTTPLKAIRLHCIECMGYMASEVKVCTSPNCNLYKYRMGRNPKRKGMGGDTTKAREALRKAR